MEEFSSYCDFYVELIKTNPENCKKFMKKIFETAVFNVFGPPIQNLNWYGLSTFGLFIAFINESVEDFNLLDWFIKMLCEYLLYNNDELHGYLEFTNVYLGLASKFDSLSPVGESAKTLELLMMNMFQAGGKYQEAGLSINIMLNDKLNLNQSNDEVTPSFRAYVQSVLANNSEDKIPLDIRNSEKSAKLFYEAAISRPFIRACDFAKEMGLIKSTNPWKPDHHQAGVSDKLIIAIFNCIENDFKKFELHGSTNARLPVGLSAFTCELFKVKMMTTAEFYSYAKRMRKIALQKPTMCTAMCFLIFYRVFENDEELKCHDYYKEMKNGKKELDKFDLSRMKFSDDILDSVDCLNALELK